MLNPINRLKKFVVLLSIISALLIPVLPVFADHYYEILDVSCTAGVVTITVDYWDYDSSADTYIFVNGSNMMYFDPARDFGNSSYPGYPLPLGISSISISDPAFVTGAVIAVSEGEGAIETTCVDAPSCSISDGAVNMDCARPIAVYKTSGGFDIYGINPNTSEGILSFSLSSSELADIPSSGSALIASGTNAGSGQPIMVYRLSDGSIQVHTNYADGKPYQIRFNVGGAGLQYLSY